MSRRCLLVILAHPDDETFGMGGTLAKYAALGTPITLVSATRGEKGIPNRSAGETARIRENELRAAAAELGIQDVRFLDYVDGELAQANSQQATAKVANLLKRMKPAVVITFGPDGISGHPDHVAISCLVTQAFSRVSLPNARLFYIAPSEATQQGCGAFPVREMGGGPIAAIDVGEYLVTKVRAAQKHASQHPPFPGAPEEEANRLACHEYFTLAHPPAPVENMTDLFNENYSTENA